MHRESWSPGSGLGRVAGWLAGAVLLVSPMLAQSNVTTYHYDNARTGLNANETVLTPANVNAAQFGRLFTQAADGQIYGQPLYVAHLAIPDKGTHNVIFVATQGDSVYAFDADSNQGENASPLWHVSLLDAAHGAAAGATTADIDTELHCTAIVPKVGVTSTPVIDIKGGTIFVESLSYEGKHYVHRIHVLDLTTGAERKPGPVVVSASVPGTGDENADKQVHFDAMRHLNRPGLLLVNGVLYVGYGTHCDRAPAHGWLFAYDAATLAMKDVFLTTPNGRWGGIWMTGAGLAADEQGNIFIATGNGSFDDSGAAKDLSQSILKLALQKDKFALVDYFTPFNHDRLNRHDRDLGAGGVLLLPDQQQAPGHLLVQSGKEGKIYVLNRDQMTHDNLHVCVTSCTSDPQIYQEIPNAIEGMFSTPAYWNNMLYFWGSGDMLKAYKLVEGKLSATPVAVSHEKYEHPGANLSVSSNGNTNGILWAIRTEAFVTQGPAVLAAYDASDVSHLLYSSNMNAARDTAGGAVKFAVPTVINGKVYVGADRQLNVYGLLPAQPQSPAQTK